MPEVSVGDSVYFHAHDNAEPVMAFVTKVGRETLVVWALAPGYGGVEKPSVRHKDDPRLSEGGEWKQYGTWCLKPRDPRVAQLSERLSLLEKRFAELVGDPPAKSKASVGNK
jgi:hypothetical protein